MDGKQETKQASSSSVGYIRRTAETSLPEKNSVGGEKSDSLVGFHNFDDHDARCILNSATCMTRDRPQVGTTTLSQDITASPIF